MKTIVLIRPIRAAIRAAESDETAASRFAPKKIAPRTAGSTPHATWNQYAIRLWGMNPPPNASMEKRRDRRSTTPLERPSPKRRRMPSSLTVAGGASMAVPRRQNPMAIAAPMTAYPTTTAR